MAGETRGELAEAIAKVAVETAAAKAFPTDTVYWQETPEDAVIKPDITVGPTPNAPKVVILVNASDSPKESEKKFWRNVGEIFDAKSRLVPAPLVCVLVFRSEIKPELIRLTAAISDSAHLVDRDPAHGASVSQWLEANHATAPSAREGKEALIRQAVQRGSQAFDASFAAGMVGLTKAIREKMIQRNTELVPLWELAARDYLARRHGPFRSARTTLLRRGLARWLVFDPDTRSLLLAAHYRNRSLKPELVPAYAAPLGMLVLSVAGGVIPVAAGSEQDMVATAGSDLRLAAEFFRTAAHGDAAKAAHSLEAAVAAVPPEMTAVAARLRALPGAVSGWHRFTTAKWGDLCTPRGCYDALVACNADPSFGGAFDPAEGNWVYDHLVAVLRANAGRNNDFGYGSLVAGFKAAQASIPFQRFLNGVIAEIPPAQVGVAKRWVTVTLPKVAEPGRRGFQDWLVRKKDVSPVVVGAFAFSLASKLKAIKDGRKLPLPQLIAAHAYGLWNKLLTYQDFEPLPALVEAACETKVRRVGARTVMADLAEHAVQDAGKMPALAFNGGLICWKSVTDSGKDHKRKELSGRARALRFGRSGGVFRVRESAQKLLLVVDGTFNDVDVAVLAQSGWDGIFYPDEMDELVRAMS